MPSEGAQFDEFEKSYKYVLRKFLRHQLAALLHARECALDENSPIKCQVLTCDSTKFALHHMRMCNAGVSCPETFCASSKRILRHWKECKELECIVCFPIKQSGMIINFSNVGQFDDIDTDDQEIPPIPGASECALRMLNGEPMETEAYDDNTQQVVPSTHQSDSSSESEVVDSVTEHQPIVSNEEPVEMRRMLNILYHTHRCWIRERKSQGQAKLCPLPRCSCIRRILNHMKTCNFGESCSSPHCSLLWRIIRHWKFCCKSSCKMCVSSKRAESICVEYFGHHLPRTTGDPSCSFDLDELQAMTCTSTREHRFSNASIANPVLNDLTEQQAYASSCITQQPVCITCCEKTSTLYSTSTEQLAHSSTSTPQQASSSSHGAHSSTSAVQNRQCNTSSAHPTKKGKGISKSPKKSSKIQEEMFPNAIVGAVTKRRVVRILPAGSSVLQRSYHGPRVPPLPANVEHIVSNPERFESHIKLKKQVQRQLFNLIHASRCSYQPSEKCGTDHCKLMKDVLNHMNTCTIGGSCAFPHCTSSRAMLHHWNSCTNKRCYVCFPVKMHLKIYS